jgi:hypothetical protein
VIPDWAGRTVAVLGSGPSISQAQADACVAAGLVVVALTRAIKLAGRRAAWIAFDSDAFLARPVPASCLKLCTWPGGRFPPRDLDWRLLPDPGRPDRPPLPPPTACASDHWGSPWIRGEIWSWRRRYNDVPRRELGNGHAHPE